MRDIDEIDRELLRLLLEDGRTPYSDLAEAVELSPPAVSERIDRLRELGVIRRFTIDIDHSTLREGVRVAATLDISPGESQTVRETLSGIDGVEYVFVTADSRLFVVATVPDGDVEARLAPVFETGAVEAVDVTPLVDGDWHPGLGEATLGLECVECGNTVTDEGVSAEIGGDRYEFCCPSCRGRFEERYEQLQKEA